MRPRSLLVLLALVAGLLAFIWFYERELPSSDERRQRGEKVLVLEPEDATGLTIERGGVRVELAKTTPAANDEGEVASSASDGGWQLIVPLEARADDDLVESLLSTLGDLEKKRTLEQVERSELGLTEPRASLTVTTDQGQRQLLIGAEIPASSSMVVAVDGSDQAFVVDNGLWEDLDREPGDWRSRDVFSGVSDEIERITLIRGDQRLLLARRGEDFWIEAPLVDRADEDKVSDLLFDLTRLQVERFIDEPTGSLAEMGLDPPVSVLEVVLRDRPEPFRVEVGSQVAADQTRRYARFATQAMEIKSDLADAMEWPFAEWRSLNWASLESYQVDTIRVTAGEDVLELERAGGKWKRGEEEISFAPVSDFLYAATDAKAERLLDEYEAEGLDLETQLVVELAGKDGEEELRLFQPALGGYPAQSADREAILLLPRQDVEELKEKLSEIRSAEPTSPVDLSPAESAEENEQN